MDIITHTMSGVILSRTGFYQRWGRAATIALVGGAIVPDIDHFTLRFAGPVAYLKYHRGFTHSLIGIIPLAIILAFLIPLFFSKWVKGKIDYPNLAGLGILGIITHIFLDLITSYATQIFFPFDDRYSLDLVFIIDPYFSLIFILPPILWKFKKEKAKALAFAAVVMVFAYLIFAYTAKNLAIKSAKEETQRMKISASRIEAVPMPFSPFKWSVFIEDEKKFYQMDVDIVRDKINTSAFDKTPSGDDMIKKADSLEMVKVYKWFARFPVITSKTDGDNYIIEYYDIRFNSMPPRKPFLLKVILNNKDGAFKEGELFFHSIKP